MLGAVLAQVDRAVRVASTSSVRRDHEKRSRLIRRRRPLGAAARCGRGPGSCGRQQVQELAAKYYEATNFLYLGRNYNFPIALEGALKLKEISYIHAEGYPAGEMKHGPIALIDERMPVLCLAPQDPWHEKMISQIQQAKARGGIVIAVATDGDELVQSMANHILWVPETPWMLSPVVTVLPLQLLAYHIASLRGLDVDQPRNLAKSVTVE